MSLLKIAVEKLPPSQRSKDKTVWTFSGNVRLKGKRTDLHLATRTKLCNSANLPECQKLSLSSHANQFPPWRISCCHSDKFTDFNRGFFYFLHPVNSLHGGERGGNHLLTLTYIHRCAPFCVV